MKKSITKIAIEHVDTAGAKYEVAGVWKDKPFYINIWCEFEGRDVESETIRGGYDPMEDFEEPMFFDFLCQDERFTDLHGKVYKIYEQLVEIAHPDSVS